MEELNENTLNETTRVSFHKKTVTKMALEYLASLHKLNIVPTSHNTTDIGTHVIHYISMNGKPRVTFIEPIFDKSRYNTKITNSPLKKQW